MSTILDNDIGRGSHGALYVKSAFDYALFNLMPAMFHETASVQMFTESGRYVQSLFISIHIFSSVLARIIRITDEVIDYRDWLRGRLMHRGASSDGGYNTNDCVVSTNGTIRSYAHVVAASPPKSNEQSSSASSHRRMPSDGSISDLSAGGDEAVN